MSDLYTSFIAKLYSYTQISPTEDEYITMFTYEAAAAIIQELSNNRIHIKDIDNSGPWMIQIFLKNGKLVIDSVESRDKRVALVHYWSQTEYTKVTLYSRYLLGTYENDKINAIWSPVYYYELSINPGNNSEIQIPETI